MGKRANCGPALPDICHDDLYLVLVFLSRRLLLGPPVRGRKGVVGRETSARLLHALRQRVHQCATLAVCLEEFMAEPFAAALTEIIAG